jgi:hypothetical protein
MYGTGIRFSTKKQEELLYITKSSIQKDQSEIQFSSTTQFNSRVITTAKLKEILDSAEAPIYLRIGENGYIAGKGFLAKFVNINRIEPLFAATFNTKDKTLSIGNIKFYISRKIYQEEHKKIFPAMTDSLNEHIGDVIISNDIDRFICLSMGLPAFKTLTDRKEYMEQFSSEILSKWQKE